MILSAQSIRRRCTSQNEKPLISPFVERTVFEGKTYGLSSAGYDIRVDSFMLPNTGKRGKIVSEYLLLSNDFILASSVERICMPKDLIAIVHDKSSWARKGLAVQNTVLEPGWEGYITLELSLHSMEDAFEPLTSGMPIAQLVFHQLDESTTQPYEGKYQNQEKRPVKAIYEE